MNTNSFVICFDYLHIFSLKGQEDMILFKKDDRYMNKKIKNQELFPGGNEGFWKNVLKHIDQITEIRIRVHNPIIIYHNHKEISLDKNGELLYSVENGYSFDYIELQKLIDFWCMDSRYAFQEEIKKGFITIKGGHRIGICGEVIYDVQGKIQTIKYISSINIRIAHEIQGIANSLMRHIYLHEKIANTLIISPPGMGKTTLLRDMIRLISDGMGEWQGKNVAVIDERGEIAACYQGIWQLNVGKRTDVLYGCNKEVGMRMLLQSMAPQVIAMDELVTKKERNLVQQLMGRGSAVIATMHGENKIDNIRYQKWYKGFQVIIFLVRIEDVFHTQIYKYEEGKKCKKYWEQYLLSQDF